MNFLNDISVSNNVTATGTVQAANMTATSLADGSAYTSFLVENSGVFYKKAMTLGGTLLPTGTEGQTLYNNAGVWTAHSGVFWDDTNNRLGVGVTASLAAKIHTKGSGATSSTYSFKAENSSAVEGLSVRDDGLVTVNTLATPNTTLVTNLNADLWDGYHLNVVGTSLRANVNISGGGTITFGASPYLSWSSRFIVISNGSGAFFSTNGYFDITCPTSGTITGVGGAADATANGAGIPITGWQALYYILPIGSGSSSIASNFRLASYISALEVPHHWVLLAVYNSDNLSLRLPNGLTLRAGQSYDTTVSTSAYPPYTGTLAASNDITAVSTLGGTVTLTRAAGNITAAIDDSLSFPNNESSITYSILGAFLNNALTNCTTQQGATLTTSVGGTAGVVITNPGYLIAPYVATQGGGSREPCSVTTSNGGTATFTITGVVVDTPANTGWDVFFIARTASSVSGISNILVEIRDSTNAWITMYNGNGVGKWTNNIFRAGIVNVAVNYPPNGVRITLTFNAAFTAYYSEIGLWNKNYMPGRGLFGGLAFSNKFTGATNTFTGAVAMLSASVTNNLVVSGSIRSTGNLLFDSTIKAGDWWGSWNLRVLPFWNTTPNSRAYIRLQVDAMYNGGWVHITVSGGQSGSTSTVIVGAIEADYVYYCNNGPLTLSEFRITNKFGPTYTNGIIKLGSLVIENGYISIPIWITNGIYGGSIIVEWFSENPGIIDPTITAWVADTMPTTPLVTSISGPMEVQNGMLDLYSTANSSLLRVRGNSVATGGLYAYADTATSGYISVGSEKVAGSWTARGTSAALFGSNPGAGTAFEVYCNTSLTSGNTYTASQVFSVSSTGVVSSAGGFTSSGGDIVLSNYALQILGSSNGFSTYVKTYTVNTATAATLVNATGTALPLEKAYLLEAYVAATSGVTGAKAVVWNDAVGTRYITKIWENGLDSNHIEFYLDTNVPKVRLYNHTTLYPVGVRVTETATAGSVRSPGAFTGGMIYENAQLGSVGIGTSSPGASLHISTSATGNSNQLRFGAPNISVRTYNVGIFDGGALGANFGIYDNTSAVNRFTITSAGDVGLGATVPQRKLDVRGYIQIGADSGTPDTEISGIRFKRTTYGGTNDSAAINFRRAGSGGEGQLSFATRTGDPDVAPVERLRITNLGRFGFNLSATTPVFYQFGDLQTTLGSNVTTPTMSLHQTVGAAGTVVDALRIDCYCDTAFDKGVAISMGYGSAGALGEYTSRIVHYGNVSGTRATKLAIQTHSVTAHTWNPGILIDNLGYVGINTTSITFPLEVYAAGTGVARLTSAASGTSLRFDTLYTSTGFERNWAIGANLNAYGDFAIMQSAAQGGDPLTGSLYRLYIANTTGYVGIGTTSATYPLTVRRGGGSGSFGVNIDSYFASGRRDVLMYVVPDTSTDLGGYVFKTHNGVAGDVDALSITPTGNVGIGTTAPGYKLQVHSAIAAIVGGNNLPGVLSGIAASPYYGTSLTLAGDAGAAQAAHRIFGRYSGIGGVALTFEYSTNTQAYGADPSALTYAEAMRITNAGLIGIGTTAPNTKLTVLGGGTENAAYTGAVARFQNSTTTGTDSRVSLVSGNAAYTDILFGDTDDSDIGYIGYSHILNSMTFGTNNAAQVTILSTGFVGIGTTAPGAKLHVSGDVLLDNNKSLQFKDSSGNIRNILNFSSADNIALAGIAGTDIYIGNSNSIVSKSTGAVGIGTATPGAKLHVSTATTVKSDLKLTSGVVSGEVSYLDTTQNLSLINYGTYSLADSTYSSIRFYTNNDTTTPKVTVQRLGNVGIGTTNPTEKLYVLGNILCTSTLIAANSAITTSETVDRMILYMGSVNPERGGLNLLYNLIATAKPLFATNEEFETANPLTVYNNFGGTKLTHTRQTAQTGVPNQSGCQIKISYDGTGTPGTNPTPGYGGFYLQVNSAPNRTIALKFRAKVPAGRILVGTGNAFGANALLYWLTPQTGTDKWEDYVVVWHSGNTGAFSTVGFVYVDGSSANTAFDWYVAQAMIYDLSASPQSYYAPINNPTFTGSLVQSTTHVDGSVSADAGEFLFTDASTGTITSKSRGALQAGYSKTGASAYNSFAGYGISSYAYLNAGSINNYFGVTNRSQVGGCAVVTMVDFMADSQYGTTGTVGTRTGVKIQDFNKAVGQTLTTQYGLYIENMNTAVSNYAIWSTGSATSYLGGNLSIGNTSTGTARLQVDSTAVDQIGAYINTSSNTYYSLSVYNNGGNALGFQVKAGATAGSGVLINAIDTANVPIFKVMTSGKVGVGIAAPAYPLHVNSSTGYGAPSATSTPNGLFTLSNDPNTGLVMNFGIDASSGVYGWVQPRNSGSANFYNLALCPVGGNVGIGIAAPVYPLQIRKATGGGSLGISINNVMSTYGRDSLYYAIGDVNTDLTGHAWYVRNGTVTDNFAMGINNLGYVGINKANPGTALDVAGTVTATSFVGPLTGSASQLQITGDDTTNADEYITWSPAGGGANTIKASTALRWNPYISTLTTTGIYAQQFRPTSGSSSCSLWGYELTQFTLNPDMAPDLLAFNPPTSAETYNGTTWSATTIPTGLFDGQSAHDFSAALTVAYNSCTKMRFTWNSFGRHFICGLASSFQSSDNSFRYIVQGSADGVTYSDLLTTPVYNGWPGYSTYFLSLDTGASTYLRIIIEFNWTSATSLPCYFGSIRMPGTYGGFNRLFTWDYLRKVTFPGQIASTYTGGPQIYLNGATSNYVEWNTNGVGLPTFTTSSVGTKLRLYPSVGAAAADFAIGIAANTQWFGVPSASQQFQWYAGTTNVMTLSGAGALTTTGQFIQSSTDANTTNYNNAQFSFTDSSTGTITTKIRAGLVVYYNKSGSSTFTSYNSQGIYSEAALSAGTITNAHINIQSRTNVLGCTVGNVMDFAADAQYGTTGSVSNRYCFYVADFNKTGAQTLGNQYGLYVSALTSGGTSNYAVYTAGTTPSFFGGRVGIASLPVAGCQLYIDSAVNSGGQGVIQQNIGSWVATTVTTQAVVNDTWINLTGATATVPLAAAYNANGMSIGTGISVTNYCGFRVAQWPSGAGSVTNANLGFLCAGAAGANNYGVYVTYSQSYFGGNIIAGGGLTGATSGNHTGSVFINRSGAVASGINWYSNANTAWIDYMAPPQASQGPSGTVTAPSGTYVTSWARRSFVESIAGYGWTWESGSINSTTPAVVAELSSATGNFRTTGTVYAAGFSGVLTGSVAGYANSLSEVNNNVIRISNPLYATYNNASATPTGAFKIKLPAAAVRSQTMMRMTIHIYEYNAGKSVTLEIGGYNYNNAGTVGWTNCFAFQHTQSGPDLNVRFGYDGTSECIWIGEVGTVWHYVSIAVKDFQGSHQTVTDAAWRTGWSISMVTAFAPDTVQTTILAGAQLHTQNYSSYALPLTGGTVSGASTFSNGLTVSNGLISNSWIQTNVGTSVGGAIHHNFATGALSRFALGLVNAESSANAGSDFTLWRYNDAGSYLGTVFSVTRSTGTFTHYTNVVINNDADGVLQINGTAADATCLFYGTGGGGTGKVRIQKDGKFSGLSLNIRSGTNINAGSLVASIDNAGAIAGSSIIVTGAASSASLTVTGLTGYLYANGASAVTASTTIPGGSINGAVASATTVEVADSRAVTTTPQTVTSKMVVFDFKSNTAESLSDGGTYFGEMTFRKYGSGTDWSGGASHQLGFTDNGNIHHRYGTSTTWGSWYKILDSNNYNSYAPTLTGTGASGSWGISVTGNAATATTATTATNVAGGTTGAVHYQSGVATTAMLSLGTTNYVLTAGAAAPQWTAQSSITSGACSGNSTTATTATNATNTAITDDTTTNQAMYLTWVTTASGNQAQKVSSSKLTFNPFSGVLAASGGFSGSITGSSSSCSGNSVTATTATKVAVTASSGTQYLAMFNSASGSSLDTYAASSLTWNTSASKLTAAHMDLSGNLLVSGATTVTDDNSLAAIYIKSNSGLKTGYIGESVNGWLTLSTADFIDISCANGVRLRSTAYSIDLWGTSTRLVAPTTAGAINFLGGWITSPTSGLTTLYAFTGAQVLAFCGAGTGTGTVTSVSVASANGFTGSVATSTTTPAITLTTSVTGLLKGNGTAISAAVAGTDYVTPGSSPSFGTVTATLSGNCTGSSGSCTGNAGSVGGLVPGTTANTGVNELVRTNANGYCYFGWINTQSGDNGTTAITKVYASHDPFIRTYTMANFTAQLTGTASSLTAGAASVAYAIPTSSAGASIYVDTATSKLWVYCGSYGWKSIQLV